MSLRVRLAAVMMATIIISVCIQIVAARTFIKNYIISNGSNRVLNIAKDLSIDPEIIDAFLLDEPQYVIQPIVERTRVLTETSFIVVFNMNSVRYSHPVPSRIGKKFIGGDEERALKGESYVSTARGTLTTSIRSFVPIKNEEDQQIGVISVGLNLDDLQEETRNITAILYYIGMITLVIGIVGSTVLSQNIKKSLFGLEPVEIATLLEERNIIISTVMEGIVAVDRKGDLLLINESARRLLSIEDKLSSSMNPAIYTSIGLDSVIATGESSIDDEISLCGRDVVVNRIPMVSGDTIIGAVATLRDRSEMKLLAGELMAIKQYTTALRAQKHEFMNKLQVVSGLLQINRSTDALAYIKSTVSKQQQSVDSLRLTIEPAEILALVLAKMDEANEANIIIKIEDGSHLPSLGYTATAAFITIIGNLIQNAIESLKTSEQQEKCISLHFSQQNGWFDLNIEDNGIGIDPSLRDKLFLQGTTSKGEGHMGVGLYLVKKQVEVMQGEIEIIENSGVKISIRIPLDKL